MLQIFSTMRRERLAAVWLALWIGGTGLLGGCSWLHFGSSDEESYDYRKSKPRQDPLDVPPDLSQLPKDDRFALPTAASASKSTTTATTATPAAASTGTAAASTGAAAAAPAATSAAASTTPSATSTNTGQALLQAASAPASAAAPVANADAAPQIVPAAMAVSPAEPRARILHEGNARWLAVDVSPELAYTTLKEMWTGMGYKIQKDEPLVGIVETDWSETRPEINEDAIRNGLHKAFGAFDSNGERNKFRARIERTSANTTEITITNRGMVEIVTGIYHDSSKWQARPPDPELEAEMLHRLALRFAPAQPLRVAVASESAAAAAAAAAPSAAATVPGENAAVTASSRVHRVASGGSMTLQVEDTLDHTWRQVGMALDRGGFTVEERRRDKNVYAVRYLDPDYEASEREKRSWWNRVFNADAKVPEQQFLIAMTANGATTVVEVQDKEGRPDSGATAKRILDQLMEQLR